MLDRNGFVKYISSKGHENFQKGLENDFRFS